MILFPTRPALEVADILRAHGEAYRAGHAVSALQAAIMRRLVACYSLGKTEQGTPFSASWET